MDRDRRPQPEFEDQYRLGRGQSYRPGGAPERSPIRKDNFRARSPPARHASYGDSYGGPRPRSRSPLRRGDFRRRTPSPPRYRDAPLRDGRGGGSYRGRPRSPFRRDDLPRDDLFRREPPLRDHRDERGGLRDERGYPGRSPPPRFRERSPGPMKRARDPSPVSSRGRRTPPLAKRERLISPQRARYGDHPQSRGPSPSRRRTYSPGARGPIREHNPNTRSPLPRSDRFDPRAADDWRRPRSPNRFAHLDSHSDSRGSGATSRRSSPPVHPSRPAPASNLEPRSNRPIVRDEKGPVGMPDSRQRGQPSPRDRPQQDESRPAARPLQRDTHRDDLLTDSLSVGRSPLRGPPAESSTKAAIATPSSAPRAPIAPPSGPRSHVPATASIRGRGGYGGDMTNRGGHAGDSAGRGGHSTDLPGRGGYPGDSGIRGGRGGFGSIRGGRGGNSTPNFGGRNEHPYRETEQDVAPPTGPRVQAPLSTSRQSLSAGPPKSGPPYASRSQRFGPNGQPISDLPISPVAVAAPTGPRSRRWANESNEERAPPGPHSAIADLPKIVDGGQKAEPLIDMSRLTKLEDEAERLRRAVDEREMKKRKSLREWDRLTREIELAALKSDLAEQSIRALNGEVESQAAF